MSDGYSPACWGLDNSVFWFFSEACRAALFFLMSVSSLPSLSTHTHTHTTVSNKTLADPHILM